MKLSKAELAVLQAVVDGRTTAAALADHRCTSQRTVKNHLASIYSKLDAVNMTDAVLIALRAELVSL